MNKLQKICQRLKVDKNGRYTCQAGMNPYNNYPLIEREVVASICERYDHANCTASPDFNQNLIFTDFLGRERLLNLAIEIASISLEFEQKRSAQKDYLAELI